MRKKSAQFIREHWPALFGLSLVLSLFFLVMVLRQEGCLNQKYLLDEKGKFLIGTLLSVVTLSFLADRTIAHYKEKDNPRMVTVTAIIHILMPVICALCFAKLFLLTKNEKEDFVCPTNNNQIENYVSTIRASLSQYVTACLEQGTAQQESDWEVVQERIISQEDLIKDSVLRSEIPDSACRSTLGALLDQKLAERSDTVTQRVDELLTLTRALKGMDHYSQGQVQAMMEHYSIMNDAVICDPSNRKICLFKHAGMHFSAANPGGDKLNTIVRLKKEDNIISQIIIR
jgi:hypothetical protein